MRAVRPYVTAGVALVGASVISATPLTPLPVQQRTSNQQVSLAAASATACNPGSAGLLCGGLSGLNAGQVTSAVIGAEPSLLNIPQNLINAFLSIPAWEVQAMDRFSDAMIATGSWQVWSPTNVLGFDEQDPPKLQAYIDMLIPFQPFSSALGEDLAWWARANLPMNAGCAALPGACPDPDALLNGMFQVPMSQLYDGYTFPTVTNPFTGEETPWSGQYVQLEPWGPFTSSAEWLIAPPRPVETTSFNEAFDATQKLIESTFASYYPFVQNSEWYNDEQTDLAPFFRALAPILCNNCDPDKPYDNPWLYTNYPPNSDEEDATSDSATLTEDAPTDTGDSDTTVPVSDAVTSVPTAVESSGAADDATADQVVDNSPEEIAEAVTDAETHIAAATQSSDTDEAEPFGRHRSSADDDSTSVKSIKDRIDAERDDSQEADSDTVGADSGTQGVSTNSAAGEGSDSSGQE
ncbi:hypothetical protein NGTWS1803_06540 [Mycolicibacterium cyprinidarum]|nr:hypothetical protein NGTWS1803_06540 [Mycolicibacterium sp. NGTWS1803]